MGDFEKTFGAGADAAGIVDKFTEADLHDDLPPEELAYRAEMRRQNRRRKHTFGSMNRVTLIGIITDDVASRNGDNGTHGFHHIGVITHADSSEENTEVHDVRVELTDSRRKLPNFLRSGVKVMVEGVLTSRSDDLFGRAPREWHIEVGASGSIQIMSGEDFGPW